MNSGGMQIFEKARSPPLKPEVIIMIPVLLFSLSLHEYSHALAAWWAGDDTASRQGRLTMNPISHIDLMGTIIVPLICLAQSMAGGVPFFFGWAKPVPVNPNRVRKRYWDVIVSAAGPASNFLLAFIFTLLLKIMYMNAVSSRFSEHLFETLSLMMYYFIALNVLLCMFNLLPIPPLDGSHIFFHFFVKPFTRDHPMFKLFVFMERFGFILLMILMFVIPDVINPFHKMYRAVMWLISLFIVI